MSSGRSSHPSASMEKLLGNLDGGAVPAYLLWAGGMAAAAAARSCPLTNFDQRAARAPPAPPEPATAIKRVGGVRGAGGALPALKCEETCGASDKQPPRHVAANESRRRGLARAGPAKLARTRRPTARMAAAPLGATVGGSALATGRAG